MAEIKSKNYDRYLKWYQKGSITEEQLQGLVNSGLLTSEEKESIVNYDKYSVGVGVQ